MASRATPPPTRHPQAKQTYALPVVYPNQAPPIQSPMHQRLQAQLDQQAANHKLATPSGQPFHPLKVLHHFDKLQKIAQGKIVQPVTVEIDPSNVCNHHCQWCVSLEAHTGEMLTFKHYQDLITELKQLGTLSIVLKGGGEPTVHKQINQMLLAGRDAGLKMGLITNGSMPHQGTCDVVSDCVDWVRFSIDAPTAQTHHRIHGNHDFNRIIEHVRHMAKRAHGPVVGMNYVVEQRNFDQIVDFTLLARSLGVSYVSIRRVFDFRQSLSTAQQEIISTQVQQAALLKNDIFSVFAEGFDDFPKQMHPKETRQKKPPHTLHNASNRPNTPNTSNTPSTPSVPLSASSSASFEYERCLGPNMVGVVGADGQVYACCFLRGNSAFSFGDIKQQTFDDIWHSQRRQDIMENIYQGKCNHVCLGGMTANRYHIYNQILNYLASENKQHADFV